MQKIAYGLIALAIIALHSCGPTHVIVESNEPAPAPPPPPPPAPEVSYQAFYDDLSPYGQWIDNPQYGYVWMPNAGPDFKPYATNGHWVYSDNGWIWASDYNWGWVTFHYGRWFFEDGYGWMWIPGYEWAPAWVSWRRSDDYYGWAPLGPSVTISASFGGGYNPPSHYWNFVPQQYVTSPQVNNYYVNEQRNVVIINNTTVIHNTTIVNNNVTNNHVTVNNYAGGPDPQEVSRVTGAPLRPVMLRTGNTPGERAGDGSLTIYRPRVNPAPQAGNSAMGGLQPRFAPAHVQTLNNTRPVNTNSYSNNRGNISNTNITNNTTTNNNTTNNNTNTTTNNVNVNTNNRPVVNPSNPTPPTGYGRPANQSANQPPAQNTPRPRSFQTPGQPVSGQPSANHPLLNQPPNQAFIRPAAPNNASKPNQPLPPPRTVNYVKPAPKKDTVSRNRPRPQ